MELDPETIKSMKNQENVVKSWKPTKNREKNKSSKNSVNDCEVQIRDAFKNYLADFFR